MKQKILSRLASITLATLVALGVVWVFPFQGNDTWFSFTSKAQLAGPTSLTTQSITINPQTPIGTVSNVIASPSIQGSTAYYYWFVSHVGGVVSPPSGPFVVSNGTATIGGINTVSLSWTPVSGATYDILRTTTSTTPIGTASIAVSTGVTGATFTDNVAVGSLTSYAVLTSLTQVPITLTNLNAGNLLDVISAPTNFGTGISATNILVAPVTATYSVTAQALVSAVGAGCGAGTNTATVGINWTSPGGTAQGLTFTATSISANGSLDTGDVGGQGQVVTALRARIGTPITYTVTSTLASAGCSPIPQYTVYAQVLY